MHKMTEPNFWDRLIQLMFIWSCKTTCISQCWFGWGLFCTANLLWV